jgi:hypothetical protein
LTYIKACSFFVIPISTCMQLMMYIGSDLIEAIPVNVKDLRVPGYLGKFKRNLKVKYSELIKTSLAPVEFLVFETESEQKEFKKEN